MSKRLFTGGSRLPIPRLTADLRSWLARVALSLAAALLAGALAYLVARAIGSVVLLAQQQELLRQAASALRGGVEGLAGSNLREVRLRVQQIDARYEQLSLVAGFASAALAAVASYLWLERRSSVVSSPSLVATDHGPRTTDSNGN
jgi:hypothetical protein